jgi:hypothetical protein
MLFGVAIRNNNNNPHPNQHRVDRIHRTHPIHRIRRIPPIHKQDRLRRLRLAHAMLMVMRTRNHRIVTVIRMVTMFMRPIRSMHNIRRRMVSIRSITIRPSMAMVLLTLRKDPSTRVRTCRLQCSSRPPVRILFIRVIRAIRLIITLLAHTRIRIRNNRTATKRITRINTAHAISMLLLNTVSIVTTHPLNRR